MDKDEFKRRLEENEYENINVLQLFGLQDNVYVGGSVEIYHKPCGHTDSVIFKQGIYEELITDRIEDYCSECIRAMNNTVEFVKRYIHFLYVDAIIVPDNMLHSKVLRSKSYTDFFKSNINLDKFAKKYYTLNPLELMRKIDEYITDNAPLPTDENNRLITAVKVDKVRNRLTHFRTMSAVSRKELADRTGIAFKTIENYELGRTKLTSISIENALKIADVLDIKAEFLV